MNFLTLNRPSRSELEHENHRLRMRMLKIKLDMNVLIFTPNSKRAARIREEHMRKIGAPQRPVALLQSTPQPCL